MIENYHEILGFSTKGFGVVLKRDVEEVWVNKFNEEWLSVRIFKISILSFIFSLQVWNANIDFSCVFDFYSIITYISDYYMKVRY